MKDDHRISVAMLIGVLLGISAGAGTTIRIYQESEREFKAEAVKRHAAEWVVDPATGSTTFKWKEVTQP